MSLVTFIARTGYTNPKGVINTPTGAFDFGAALVAGSGVITVDSQAQNGLYQALLNVPELMVSGSTPGPLSTVDVIAPVIAHQGISQAVGDMLVRGGDLLFTPVPVSNVPGVPSAVAAAIAVAETAAINAAEAASDALGSATTAAAAAVATAEAASIPLTQKGAANGVGTLDSTNRQPVSQTPLTVGIGRSTDATYGLAAPTGVGLELVIATVNGVPGLQDIRYNGVSQ